MMSPLIDKEIMEKLNSLYEDDAIQKNLLKYKDKENKYKNG